MTPHLAAIFVYPIKSLDGAATPAATVLESGALAGDRRFALFDRGGAWINGKRDPRVHLLRPAYDAAFRSVTLEGRTYAFDRDRALLEVVFREFFGQPVDLRENSAQGFPDDTDAAGPTLISTATLESIARWFGLTLDNARARFRANLEIAGVPAFWEDRLYGPPGKPVGFLIGDVLVQGTHPCQRCAVPSRDPGTGLADSGFQKKFATHRKYLLPVWAESAHFNHFYRIAVNTRIPASEAGKVLRVGDRLRLPV